MRAQTVVGKQSASILSLPTVHEKKKTHMKEHVPAVSDNVYQSAELMKPNRHLPEKLKHFEMSPSRKVLRN